MLKSICILILNLFVFVMGERAKRARHSQVFSIESSLKAISSDYGSNKERNVHLEMRNLKQTELHRLKNRGKKG